MKVQVAYSVSEEIYAEVVEFLVAVSKFDSDFNGVTFRVERGDESEVDEDSLRAQILFCDIMDVIESVDDDFLLRVAFDSE